MSRLQTKYASEVVKVLKKEFNYRNSHQVPKIDKVIINIGVGKAAQDKRHLEVAVNTVRKISAQQPVFTKAKQSIAGFKLREGSTVGLKVTLRGQRMFEFLDRLISIVLPRLRDFRGLAKTSFDRNGNYSIGIKDQSVFAELTYDDTVISHGVEITIATTANTPAEGLRLLGLLGFPFVKEVK